MPLFHMNVSPEAIVEELVSIVGVLKEINMALQRLAPAPPHSTSGPRVAGLSDLRRTDPVTVASIKHELQEFAAERNVVFNSEAFVRSIQEFEQQVKETYGREAILELPWNKAAGGLLFESDVDQKGVESRAEPTQAGSREATDAI